MFKIKRPFKIFDIASGQFFTTVLTTATTTAATTATKTAATTTITHLSELKARGWVSHSSPDLSAFILLHFSPEKFPPPPSSNSI